MARPRKELDNNLRSFLEYCNVDPSHLYFQEPSNIYMKYPCIIYSLARPNVRYANNGRYIVVNLYDLTIIDEDPDSKLASELVDHFTYCSFDRHFESDDLHHFTFNLYY